MGQQAGVSPDQRKIEHAIVFELLRDDHDERWSRAELATSLGAKGAVFDAALERLHTHGVVLAEADAILASPSTRLLDALGVIAI